MQERGALKPISDAESYAGLKQKLAEVNVFYPIILEACLQGDHGFIRDKFTEEAFEEFSKKIALSSLSPSMKGRLESVAHYIKNNIFYGMLPMSADFSHAPQKLEADYQEAATKIKLKSEFSLLSNAALIKLLPQEEKRKAISIVDVLSKRKGITELTYIELSQIHEIIFYTLYSGDINEEDKLSHKCAFCFDWAEKLVQSNRIDEAIFLYEQVIICVPDKSLKAMACLAKIVKDRSDYPYEELKNSLEKKQGVIFARILVCKMFDQFYTYSLSSQFTLAHVHQGFLNWKIRYLYDLKRKEKVGKLKASLFAESTTQESATEFFKQCESLNLYPHYILKDAFVDKFQQYVCKNKGTLAELKKQYDWYYQDDDRIWKKTENELFTEVLQCLEKCINEKNFPILDNLLEQCERLISGNDSLILEFQNKCQEMLPNSQDKIFDCLLNQLSKKQLKNILKKENDEYRQSRILLCLIINFGADKFVAEKINSFPGEYTDAHYAELYFQLANKFYLDGQLEEAFTILKEISLTGHQGAILLLGSVLHLQGEKIPEQESQDGDFDTYTLIQRKLGDSYILNMLNAELGAWLSKKLPESLKIGAEKAEKEKENEQDEKQALEKENKEDECLQQLEERYQRCGFHREFINKIDQYKNLCAAIPTFQNEEDWEKLKHLFFSIKEMCHDLHIPLPNELALYFVGSATNLQLLALLYGKSDIYCWQNFLQQLEEKGLSQYLPDDEEKLKFIRHQLQAYCLAAGEQTLPFETFKTRYQSLYEFLGGKLQNLAEDIFRLGLLKGKKQFQELDLCSFDFSSYQYLSLSDFSKAKLQNANFQGTDLSGSDFTAANLSGANFIGATLDNIIMDDQERMIIVIDNLRNLGRFISQDKMLHAQQLSLAKKQAQDLFDSLVLPMQDVICLLDLLDNFRALKNSDLKFLREERGFFGLFGRYGNTRTWSHCMVDVLEKKIAVELAKMQKDDHLYTVYQKRLGVHLSERNTRFGL